MTDRAGQPMNSVRLGQPFRFTLGFEVEQALEGAIEIGICSMDGHRVASALSTDRGGAPISLRPGEAEVAVDFSAVTFVPGDYVVNVHLRDLRFPPVDYVERAIKFTALNEHEDEDDRYRWPVLPSVRPQTAWSVETSAAAGEGAATPGS